MSIERILDQGEYKSERDRAHGLVSGGSQQELSFEADPAHYAEVVQRYRESLERAGLGRTTRHDTLQKTVLGGPINNAIVRTFSDANGTSGK